MPIEGETTCKTCGCRKSYVNYRLVKWSAPAKPPCAGCQREIDAMKR